MAICRICGAETDGDELCAECAENDRGGDVDGQLTLFGDEVGADAVQTDGGTEADASDAGSAGRAIGASNRADASRATDAEDVFTAKEVDAFDSVDALKAFGAINADIVGTQTDSTQISGAYPNNAHTDTAHTDTAHTDNAPSDGTQSGNAQNDTAAADDSAAEPETVSLHPRDPNYDAVICLSGARPEAPRSIHAAPTKLLRAEHAAAHSSAGTEHERDEQSGHNDADMHTDAEMHTDADVHTAEAVNTVTEKDGNNTEEVAAVKDDVAVKEDVKPDEEIKFAYGKHRKAPAETTDINAAEDAAEQADITPDSEANTSADESDGITAPSDTTERYGQAGDAPAMPCIPPFEDEYDDSEFLFPEPGASDRPETDKSSENISQIETGETQAGDTILPEASDTPHGDAAAQSATGDRPSESNTAHGNDAVQSNSTAQGKSTAQENSTALENNAAQGNVTVQKNDGVPRDNGIQGDGDSEGAGGAKSLPTFELSGGFGSGLISSESEISLLLEYSPFDSIIEPDIADDETESEADSADAAPETGGRLISAIKGAGSGLRRSAAAAGKAFSAVAGWLKAHPIAAVGRDARCVGRGLRRAGKFLLGTPHHPLMFNRGDAEAYAASACVARIPLMFPIPLIVHPRSRYARYSAACGAAVTLVAALGVLADRLLCMLWRSVFTTTVNRGTSFEHVTLTSAGIQAIAVTDTVFLTIMILFVAYSVFIAALGHRHPLAPRLLYRVAMIGEGRSSEKR